MPKKKTQKETTKSEPTVCVITGHSESGDDYGPWVFDKKPSDKFLKSFLKEVAPGEFFDGMDDDGPGIFGSELHLHFMTCTIDKAE